MEYGQNILPPSCYFGHISGYLTFQDMENIQELNIATCDATIQAIGNLSVNLTKLNSIGITSLNSAILSKLQECSAAMAAIVAPCISQRYSLSQNRACDPCCVAKLHNLNRTFND